MEFGFLDEKLDKIRMGPDPIVLKEGDKKLREGSADEGRK